MEFYKEDNKTIEKELNSNIKDGLDDRRIKQARQKYGSNVLKATNTISVL